MSTQNIKSISKWQVDKFRSEWELEAAFHNAAPYNWWYKAFEFSLYNLCHRIIYTNSRLFKCQLIKTELCTVCNEQKETLIRLFYDCRHVRTFLLQLRETIAEKCNINFVLASDTWILNKFIGTPIEIDCLSGCATLAKYYIYCCKIKSSSPSIMSFKQKLKSYSSLELYSKFMYAEKKKAEKIKVRWSVIRRILEYI